MIIAIFAIDVYFHLPVMESSFPPFDCIGFTPHILPAIVSVNRSYGVRKMEKIK
jgi:hypothetical protein